jgi:oxygen-dependent protoporphyrinogen oxidase
MRGKVLFVVGLGVGYLLGTRAGRRRYEQIKATARGIWESEPVQWGVSQVQEAAGNLADQAFSAAKSTITQAQGKPAPRKPAPTSSTKPRAAAGSVKPAAKATAEKSAQTRPQPKPATPMAEPSARSGVATGAIPIIPPKAAAE